MRSWIAKLPIINVFIVDLAGAPTLWRKAVAASVGIYLGIFLINAPLSLISSPVPSSTIKPGILI